jgi:long-chain fatty acid transport protein
VPFGGSAEWDTNDAYEGSTQYPGAVDGVQRWANISGEQRSLYATVAGAYRIPFAQGHVSVGASLSAVNNAVETVRARNVSGTDDLSTPSGNLVEGRSLLEVSGWTAALGLGALVELNDMVWIGLSYQSQPGFGQQTLSGTLTNKFGANPAGNATDVEMTQSLPDIVRAAVRVRFDDLELRLAGDYQRWSVFDRQCIFDAAEPGCELNADGSPADGTLGVILNLPRNYDDSFGVRLGASYWPVDGVELVAGTGYDANAVPDETIDPSLFDMDKIISNLGVVYALPLEGVVADLRLTYTNVFYFDREVDPRPRDAMGQVITNRPPSRNPDMSGRYEQAVHLVTVGTQFSF